MFFQDLFLFKGVAPFTWKFVWIENIYHLLVIRNCCTLPNNFGVYFKWEITIFICVVNVTLASRINLALIIIK